MGRRRRAPSSPRHVGPPGRTVAYHRPIDATRLSPDEYESFLRDPFLAERLAERSPLLVVDTDGQALSPPGSLPVVVCAIGAEVGATGPEATDLVVDEAHVDAVLTRVSTNPVAATALAILLRTSSALTVDQTLAAESAVYSMLQGAAEFARWRGGIRPEVDESSEPAVLVARADDSITISLNRPNRHNAVSRALRDELCAALEIAVVDESIHHITLRGEGPSFCSGGDLAEFGARADPAAAHLIRLGQSPARLLHRLTDRVTAHVHGATLGGGIEMAAFAHWVVADEATTIGLPEVTLGLIPGAGGTASLPARIGRQRTMALALAHDTIDAPTALAWGLVDEIR